jgi:hypothetical protein
VFRSIALAPIFLLCACSSRAAAKTHEISWTDYQRLRPGMSCTEVARIAGQPGSPSVEYDADRRAHHYMTFDSPSGVFMVQVEAGRVLKV